MSTVSAVATASPAGAKACTGTGIEAARISLLLARDGEHATREWVRRTLGIYRRAVLDPRHFASTGDYRRRFLASCLDFRRWLRRRP
jgi:hypothetical protein